MKKAIRLLLCLSLIVSAFAGCGSNTGNESSNGNAQKVELLEFPLEEPVTMDVFSWYQGDFDPENPLVKEFERLTNITLNYNAPADGYEEKESLMLNSASNDWPDIMLIGVAGGRSVIEISQQYGQAGKFVKISDYVDVFPNIKTYYETYPDSKTIFQDENGDSYIFPYIYPYKTIPTGFFINKKAFDKQGISAPTNVDELYAAAKRLKEAYPDSYPVTSYTVPETLTVWSRVFNTGPSIYFNQEKEQYEFGPFSQEYRQMLEYLNKLYAENLYDPQFPQYVFAGDDWRQTLASQKSFITESYVWEMQYENANSVNSIAKNMGFSDEVDFQYITPLEANGKASKYWGMTTVSPWYGMVIKSESPYVSEALSLLNWQLSDEFFNLLGYGIEGTTYTIKDGEPVFMNNITTTDEPGKTPLANYMSFYAGLNIYEIYPDPYGWKENLENFTGYTMEEMEKFASWPETWTVLFDQETKDNHSLAMTPAATTVEEMSYKFITGDASFNEYDQFIDTLKAYGVEEVVEDYNDYYQTQVK